MKRFIAILLISVCFITLITGCGTTETTTETIETTITEEKTPLEEMKVAQNNFTYGTYTTSIFENDWLNLRFVPYSNMYSNPELDKQFNEIMIAKNEYADRSLMEFYVKEGNSSNGHALVSAQKLEKISTAKECLENRIEELRSSIQEYPQLSLSCGERGALEFCGEQYEYQKYSILGGVDGSAGESMVLCRVLDGYAIFISIKTGYYTIEQQLGCFHTLSASSKTVNSGSTNTQTSAPTDVEYPNQQEPDDTTIQQNSAYVGGDVSTEPKNTNPCANGHTWVEITKTVHHDEVGHYEDVQTAKQVTKYRCPICGYNSQHYDSVDEYYSHFNSAHGNSANNSFFKDRYETISDYEYTTEQKWVVDTAAYDETIVTGYKCSVCNKTK